MTATMLICWLTVCWVDLSGDLRVANYLHGEQAVVGLRQELPCLLVKSAGYLGCSARNTLQNKR